MEKRNPSFTPNEWNLIKLREREAKIDRANELLASARAVGEQRRLELERLKAAINETIRLADSLNELAKQGAGFYEHWGERVMQVVEPLRNVDAFANETLRQNRSLLEYNDRLVEERDRLKAESASRMKALKALLSLVTEGVPDIPGAVANARAAIAEVEKEP